MVTGQSADERAAGVIARERPGMDEAQARIESLREALTEWRGVCAGRADSSSKTLGTEGEIAAAADVLQRSLAVALDRVGEADISAALDRGWLSADEAATALKEKRLRELAGVRGALHRDGPERDER